MSSVLITTIKITLITLIFFSSFPKNTFHIHKHISIFFLLCPRRNFEWHIKIAPSVRPSVGPSVCPSVHQSVRPLQIVSQRYLINYWSKFDETSQNWLVGCFGLNGPLRQYFSLYRVVSQREGERWEKRIEESKNVQTTPTRTYCKRNRPLSYYHQNCRTPRPWKFTQHHRTTRPPPNFTET